MCRKRSKKGFIDVITVIVLLFFLIVVIVSLGIAYKETATGLEAAQSTVGDVVEGYNESSDLVISQSNKYPAFWDFLILFIVFGGWAGLVISSYLLGNNALFLVIYVILMIALLIFGVVMQTAGKEFINNQAMDGVFDDYPISEWLLNNLLVVSIFIMITTAIALYVKIGVVGT